MRNNILDWTRLPWNPKNSNIHKLKSASPKKLSEKKYFWMNIIRCKNFSPKVSMCLTRLTDKNEYFSVILFVCLLTLTTWETQTTFLFALTRWTLDVF